MISAPTAVRVSPFAAIFSFPGDNEFCLAMLRRPRQPISTNSIQVFVGGQAFQEGLFFLKEKMMFVFKTNAGPASAPGLLRGHRRHTPL